MAEQNGLLDKEDEMESLLSEAEPKFHLHSENASKPSTSKKVNAKKRKKILDKENLKSNQRVKKRKETTKDRLLEWNTFYSNKNFGIWIQCTKCNKWRKVMEYEEAYEVPHDWCCLMSKSGTKDCAAPEDAYEEFSPVNFIPGAIVWAKFNTYPWWPAMIEDDPDTEEYYWMEKNGACFYNVTFLDDKVSRAWVPDSHIRSYLEPPKRQLSARYFKNRSLLKAAETKAKEAINMSIQERLQNFSFAHHYKGKWGPALNLDDTDEDEEDNHLTQMLLEEIGDIESNKSSDSDYRSVSSYELKKDEIDNKSGRYVNFSKDNSVNSATPKAKEKFLTKTQSRKESKPINEDDIINLESEDEEERILLNKLINEASVYIDNTMSKTEGEKENSKIFFPKKGKEVKKLMKGKISKENNIAISFERSSEKKEASKKTAVMKISKNKNKKCDKFKILEEKMDNKKENNEGGKSSTKKKQIDDTKIMSEIKKEKVEKILKSSNLKFKPPVKSNKKNTARMSSVSPHTPSSVTKEKEIFEKKESFEKNLTENKQSNEKVVNKYSTTEKMADENVKNTENNKSIKKCPMNENNLEKDKIVITEKNLKNKSTIAQENKHYISDDSSNTISEKLNAKNNRMKEEQRKQTKKDSFKEHLVSSKVQAKIKHGRTKQYAKNIMKEDLSSEDLSVLNTEKSENTNTFKLAIKQDVSQKENKRKKHLKLEEIKNETEEKKQTKENEIPYLPDGNMNEEIPNNEESKNENFFLSFEMSGQQSDEDSDPFEAE